MKISIITICYNIKDEIRRTCESIVNQTWQDFEWIVVDGGSIDGTLEILNEYKNRINIFISEKDKGVYDAMNKGVLGASGEYLNFMNGGDEFYDNKILENVFVKNDFKAGILYGGVEKIYKSYQIIINKRFNFYSPFFWHYRYMLCHQSSFIKKELFCKYSLYDLEYKSASDLDMFINFVYKHNTSTQYINRLISKFYAYDGISNSSLGISERETEAILKKYNIQKPKLQYILFNIYKFFLKRIAQITPIKSWRKQIRLLYKM